MNLKRDLKNSLQKLYPGGFVIGFILLGAAWRIQGIATRPLWVDEIFTALFAQRASIPAAISGPLSSPIPTPPLWFIITHWCVQLLGTADWVIRLPSLLAGIASIYLIYLLGKRMFSVPVGICAAGLLAVSPMHIYYSQEARFYASVVFFSLLAFYALFRCLIEKNYYWVLIWGLANLVNLYLHLTSAFIFIVQLIFLSGWFLINGLLTVPKAERWLWLKNNLFLSFSGTVLGVGVLWSPMILFLVRGVLGSRGLGNSEITKGLSLSAEFWFDLFSQFGPVGTLGVWLFIASFVVGFLWWLRSHFDRVFFLVLITFGPVIIIFLLRPKHWFGPKYTISSLPIYLIGVSLGIVAISQWLVALIKTEAIQQYTKSIIPISLLALFVWVSSPSLKTYFERKFDLWKDTADELHQVVSPQDAVVIVPVGFQTQPEELVAEYYFSGEVIRAESRAQLQDTLESAQSVWIIILPKLEEGLNPDIDIWLEEQQYLRLHVGGATNIYYLSYQKSFIELLRTTKNWNLENPNTLISVADEWFSLGRWENSITLYEQAILLSPPVESGQLYISIGEAKMFAGDTIGAETALKNAALLNPDDFKSHYLLAELYEIWKKPDLAAAQYQQALDLLKLQDQDSQNFRSIIEEKLIEYE